MSKKLLTSLVLALAFAFAVPSSVLAVDEIENLNEAKAVSIEGNTTNKETHDDETRINFMAGMVTGITGPEAVAAIDANGNRKVVYKYGLMGNVSEYIAMIYSAPPATTEMAVADFLHSAGVTIARPAYAQGLGFASLNPILNTWKTFRNVAYLFFVVIFLAIGFMIMLRQKIGGQTVVTAQQAIPHIIVSLLFVTFSYAIAGLLIDVMYVFMFLLLALFRRSPEQYLDQNFLTLGFGMISAGSGTAYNAVQGFTESAKTSLGQFGAEAIGFIGSITMAVVVAIAIALNVFKLFFELLKTYISIILNIAFAPIILMFGAIPGKNTFMPWVKNLIGNLAAFPAILLVLIVFDELTGGFSLNPSGFQPFEGIPGAPPIETGGFLPPYLFGRSGAAGALTFSVGLGMILVMPEIVVQAKKMLGASGGIMEQLASNVGDSLKRGWTGGQAIPGMGWSDTSQWFPKHGGVSGKSIASRFILGTKETRANAGNTFLGRGLLGGAVDTAERIIGIRQRNRLIQKPPVINAPPAPPADTPSVPVRTTRTDSGDAVEI